MAQHTNYWSCSSFADWIRGTNKLKMGTSEEWDEWHTQATKAHPVRYWIADTALDSLQDFVTWPIRKLYDIKYYINNRWVTRTHSLTAHATDIKPGQWQDVGNRFLPCLFNELVDFVEIETAWSHIAWSDEKDTAKYNAPFYATGWFRWRTWRCPQAGLDHLDWAMSLTNNEWCEPDHPEYGKPTLQAVRAKEIKELYLWWTETYRNRPDPYDASGWTEYCEAARLANGGKLSFGADKSPELKKQSDKAHKLLQKIEAAYEKEDEAMMIRLIKARDSLWT
jgi:hypothetical protein